VIHISIKSLFIGRRIFWPRWYTKTTLQNIIVKPKTLPQFFVITDPAIYDSVAWCRNVTSDQRVAKRMPSNPDQNCCFLNNGPIAGWHLNQRFFAKQLNIIKKRQKVQPPKFCFSLWFLYQSKPVLTLSTYGLSVLLFWFQHIITVCIMWFSVYLCICLKSFPLTEHQQHQCDFVFISIVWESIYFVISYYRIGVGIFCKVCYSVWTRFIILHIIKAAPACFIKKVPKLCTTGKTEFYSLLKIHISI